MPSTNSGWWLVTKQELRVARADGTLLWSVAGAALFAVLLAGGVGSFTAADWTGPDTIRLFGPLLLLVVPVTAASNAYSAISGPRQSGRLRVPLSLPFSRTDVVYGTAIGRFVATAIPVVALVAVALPFALTRPEMTNTLVAALGITLAGVVLTAAFCGVAVGWSAATRTPTRALLGCIAVGALCVRWWLPVDIVRYVAAGFAWPSTPRPDWLSFYGHLSPVDAYLSVLRATGFPGAGGGNGFVGVAVLLAWAVVPVVLGAARFRRADL